MGSRNDNDRFWPYFNFKFQKETGFPFSCQMENAVSSLFFFASRVFSSSSGSPVPIPAITTDIAYQNYRYDNHHQRILMRFYLYLTKSGKFYVARGEDKLLVPVCSYSFYRLKIQI